MQRPPVNVAPQQRPPGAAVTPGAVQQDPRGKGRGKDKKDE
jgi:hypothetical protein